MIANRHLIHQAPITIIVAILLFGCSGFGSTPSPSPDQMDRSPFTQIPCAAPCWHGLMIGQSNERDVMSTLPALTFIDQNTINVHQMSSLPSLDPGIWGQGVEITADCINVAKRCLAISVVEDILTEVITLMNYSIRVDEAINYLGHPNYIGFDRASGEQVACRVYLIWREKPLVLASRVLEGTDAVAKSCYAIRDTGKISPSLLIAEARYTSSRTVEALLSSSASEYLEFTGTLPQ